MADCGVAGRKTEGEQLLAGRPGQCKGAHGAHGNAHQAPPAPPQHMMADTLADDLGQHVLRLHLHLWAGPCTQCKAVFPGNPFPWRLFATFVDTSAYDGQNIIEVSSCQPELRP